MTRLAMHPNFFHNHVRPVQLALCLVLASAGVSGANLPAEFPLPRTLAGQSRYRDPCEGKPIVMRPGERYEFVMEVLGLKVMNCSLEVAGNETVGTRDCVVLVGRGQTRGAAETFGKSATLVLRSLVDARTQQMVRSEFLGEFKKQFVQVTQDYAQDRCSVHIDLTATDRQSGEVKAVNIDEYYESGAPDFLLSLFRMAQMGCPAGTSGWFDLLTPADDREEITVKDEKSIRTVLGKQPARRIAFGKNSEHFYSLDGIPLKFKIRDGLKSATISLTAYHSGK